MVGNTVKLKKIMEDIMSDRPNNERWKSDAECYQQGFDDGMGRKEAYNNLYPKYSQVASYNQGFEEALKNKRQIYPISR